MKTWNPSDKEPLDRRIYEKVKDAAIEIGGSIRRSLYLPFALSLILAAFVHLGYEKPDMSWLNFYVNFLMYAAFTTPPLMLIRAVYSFIDS